LEKKQAVEAIFSVEEGAIWDAFVQCLDEIGVAPRWPALQGDGLRREMVDLCQYVMLYGRTTLFGLEAMHALPELLCSDAAAMRLAGFNAVQMRHGETCSRNTDFWDIRNSYVGISDQRHPPLSHATKYQESSRCTDRQSVFTILLTGCAVSTLIPISNAA
jgi:hypothetical protein